MTYNSVSNCRVINSSSHQHVSKHDKTLPPSHHAIANGDTVSHWCGYGEGCGVFNVSSQARTAVCTTNAQQCTQAEIERKRDLARLKLAKKKTNSSY